MILAALVLFALGPCGDPMLVSDSYRPGPAGKVRRVIDGRTIELADDDGKTYEVTLAGVRAGTGTREALERIVRRRRIETLLHGDPVGPRFTALVRAGKRDVALQLIRRGVVQFEESTHLTHFENCKYRRASALK